MLRATAVPVQRTVVLVVSAAARGARVPRPFAEELLARVADQFTLPPRILVPLFAGPGRLPDSLHRSGDDWMRPALDAMVRVVFDSTGRARRTDFLEPTFDAGLDSSFLATVVGSLENVAWVKERLAGQFSGDTLGVDVELNVTAVRKKKEQEAHDRRKRDSMFFELPIASVMLPHYPKGKIAASPRRLDPPLEYPESQRFMNKSGHSELHAILDTNGVVLPSSLRFDQSTHRDFDDAVRFWLSAVRYQPSRIGGCPVPVRFRQPFNFLIK